MWMLVALNQGGHLYREDENPNGAHREILKREEKRLIDEKLRRLAKSFGLFFMFKGDCPYCHKFAPTLKAFAETYGFEVKAISYDGSPLREFPVAVRDNGAVTALNPEKVFPAVFLVNPHTREVIPLAWGMTSFTGLQENAQTILSHMEP